MKPYFRLVGCAVLVGVSSAAVAAPRWELQPVQIGQESLRYKKGVPTVDLELKDGVVQVTPLELDHGSLSFGIAVYNDSWRTVDFGVENIRVSYEGAPLQVFTREDLQKKAKSRALWTSLAVAAVGGVAAGLAASQQDNYRVRTVTPGGRVYRSYYSAPSAAGQFQAAAISAGTGVSIGRIQDKLDQTLANLRDEIVQRSTVDPGESYAGRIVVAKVTPATLPARVELALTWNGETYPFAFQIARPGTPAPAFAAVARRSDLISFRAGPAAAPVGPVPTVIAPASPAAPSPVQRTVVAGLAPAPSTQSAAPARRASRGLATSNRAASNSWGLVPVTAR
ncbi:hypothetical protein KRR38_22030 [Novosphingobium sp. G106]|uniref:hypothetical protein n=1 Tax=Novosphingobium sp. G106 TaxID=2849500 RepID=UPI001C2D26E1|nr:hypothetical protein [Novosphingobium sp. G106]MBV1690287.1 hypothetical protein [Novosphingobium sp. G106]